MIFPRRKAERERRQRLARNRTAASIRELADATIRLTDVGRAAAVHPSVGAAQLRSALRERGSHGELARSLGVTSQYISGWLSGRQTPSLERLCEIERRYGIAVADWRRHTVKTHSSPPRPKMSALDKEVLRTGLLHACALLDKLVRDLQR